MQRLLVLTLCPLVPVLFLFGGVLAGSPPAPDSTRTGGKSTPDAVQEKIVETTHRVTIAGTTVEYTAHAGTLALREDTEDPKAGIFFIAYTRNGTKDPSVRPVTFSFNGGPGSSSVWLHLGLLGPRRVLMDEEGNAPPPPFRLTDNEYSLLDRTDLVFIDPVSTGFSRAGEGEDPKQYHGVQEDIRAVGEFIRLYTSRYGRWASPKFLIGESYGTTRAAGLSGYLQEQHGLYLNGIMLVSSVLHFQTVRFAVGNDLPHILFLPTYTATAWYHRQLAPELQSDLQAALREAEEFALGEYASALMQGADLAPERRAAVVQKLARLTGLDPEYIEETNLRIYIWRFVKELLRDRRRTVGRLDSRFLGIDRDAAGDSYSYDPSYANILGAYAGMLNDYVRRELEFESDLPYEILTDKVYPWSYSDYEGEYVNVAETLREAMTHNPELRVFVANGYYDLATPYLATRYTFNHLGLDPDLREHVTMAHYEAGHMMYIHLPSLERMRADLVAFIEASVPPPGR